MVGLRRGQPAASPNGNLLVCVTSAMSSKHLYSFRPTADVGESPLSLGDGLAKAIKGTLDSTECLALSKEQYHNKKFVRLESPNTIVQ